MGTLGEATDFLLRCNTPAETWTTTSNKGTCPIMSKFVDLTGRKFGELTVVRRVENHRSGQAMWLCTCSCGGEHKATSHNLTCGDVRTCGCLSRKLAAEKITRHGRYNTPAYNSWRGMKDRCTNPKHSAYARYGGRGITVCDRWLESFENFYADMGERPSKQHTLDRINNDGPYSPENCRWATWEEQANNRRNNVWIEFQGERLSAAQWRKRLGVVSDLHAVAKKYNRSIASVVAAFVAAVEDGKHATPAKVLGITTRQLQTKEEALARDRRRYAEQVAAKNARRAAEMHRRLRLDVFDKEFFEGDRLDDLLSSLDTLFDEDS